MKTQTVEIPIAKDKISFLGDPTGKGNQTIYAFVKISDLPMNLPLDVNPRGQDTESRVARQIQGGLLEDPSVFHLLNRGLTMTAHRAIHPRSVRGVKVGIYSGNSTALGCATRRAP
jgi:hypothetical protein